MEANSNDTDDGEGFRGPPLPLTPLILNEEAFDKMVELLNRPTLPTPELCELMREAYKQDSP